MIIVLLVLILCMYYLLLVVLDTSESLKSFFLPTYTSSTTMPKLIPQLEHSTLQSLLTIYSEIAELLQSAGSELMMLKDLSRKSNCFVVWVHVPVCVPVVDLVVSVCASGGEVGCHRKVTQRVDTLSLADKSGRLSAAQVPSKRDSLPLWQLETPACNLMGDQQRA